MPSATVENYLKQVYLEQHAPGGSAERPVAMGRLAAAMGVVPGTATSMIKALADANLVSYEPRNGVRLTHAGQQLALHVLRRHRLVELFLVKTLGLDWSEVHAEAEELEHAISDKVLDRIDALLGHPDADPHGDPIPTRGGTVARPRHVSLAVADPGGRYRVARVADQDVAFLQFVDRCGLTPGTTLTVEAVDAAADAVRLKPHRGDRVTLGTAAAAKVFVEPAS